MNTPPEIQVSVVIPTYNRQEFVIKAIQSVQKQDWDVMNYAYEIIVVNDGSTDHTEDVLYFIAKGDPHMRVINHVKNRGIAQTLNTGIQAAKGKYVCWLSDDDKWFKNKIKIQYKTMEANPTWDMSYSDYVNNDLRHDTLRHSQVFRHRIDDLAASLRQLFKDCFINGSTIMIKREVFDVIGYFSELEENKWNQDLEFWFRLLLYTSRILHIAKPLVMRTNHYGMLSQTYCGVGNEILLPKMAKLIAEKGIQL